MQYPGRAHSSPTPWRLPAPSDQVVGGVALIAGLPSSASWLRLSSLSPPHGLLTHATPRPCAASTTQAA